MTRRRAGGRGRRARIFAGALAFAFASGAPAAGAEETTAPGAATVLYGGDGRLDVVAAPGAEGARLAALAERAWAEWTGPLGLPPRFSSGVTVRLAPEAGWAFPEPRWRVVGEPGGVVSVWIRGGGPAGVARDRLWLTALAAGTLHRQAVFLGVPPERLAVPSWLAAGAAEAALVAGQPALLDAWQAELRRAPAAAALRDVLRWTDGQSEAPADEGRRAASYGAWWWLREEGERSPAWRRFTEALLGGEAPGAALVREYGRLTPRPAEAREWELAWRVAAARLAGARTTPLLDAAETRRWLERTARIVALDTGTGAERALEAGGGWATRAEPWLAAERAERARLLAAELARLHPFYRNAAVSLGRAWQALATGSEADWRAADAEWTADLEAGRALEEASARLLDGG